MSKISQTKLDGKVLAFIRDRGLAKEGDTIVVALSGGPDSVCLFLILLSLSKKLKVKIKACHFNHKIRGEDSEKDKDFVIELCKTLGVQLFLAEREEKQIIKNENDARNLRYAYFEKILKSGGGDLIALGHNANDTAETMLQRLIRGTGLKGLSSIVPRREKFIRPLLPFTRDEIIAYLKEHNIKYRTDKTNLLPLYARNQIRLNIIPELKKFNPKVIESLSKTASLLADDYDFVRSAAVSALHESKKGDKYILERELFLNYHSALQREIIRTALESFDIANDVSEDHIYKCIKVIKQGRGGKEVVLPHSLRIALRNGKIYMFRNTDL